VTELRTLEHSNEDNRIAMIEITLAGPGKNALGTETMNALVAKIEAARGAPLLVTGDGDAFSAGLNLKEVASLDDRGMLAFLELLEKVMTALYLHPAPTVAAVNGHAIAGGCIVALCCDRRVVAKNPKLKIGVNEVALGVEYPPRTFEIVRRRVPSRFAEEIVLGAGLYDPENAVRVGLVDEIADDAVATGRARLAALAAHPAGAYAAAKRALRGATPADMVDDAREARLVRAAVPAWTSPAVREKLAKALAR
jgi:enoyl-CoA hydratase/carnithine racemase